MTRHYGNPGKLVERLDPTVFTAPRRRSAGRMVQNRRRRALAFVLLLVAGLVVGIMSGSWV